MGEDAPETQRPAVAGYKALLRELVDRRPSGTRLRIAGALGKHKSFVSQITNPDYPIPVPAKHLATIFELCHFSAEERRTFLELYEKAHPGRGLASLHDGTGEVSVTVRVPVLRDPARQATLIASIHRLAGEMGALARSLEQEPTANGHGNQTEGDDA